jgi:hypothetical protein
MPDFVEFVFDDKTSVLMEVSPAPRSMLLDGEGRTRPTADLPEGSAEIEPVSRVGETLEKTGHALAEVLSPLLPVLESVHKTVSTAPNRPDEITVELGLKLSSELHLMIVGGNGEASITVSAKWDLRQTPTEK